jgi:hypothetical protein
MRRWRSRAFILIVVALTIASVSISCGRSFVIRDALGAPVSGAYVAYHYEGSRFAIAESVTYQASRLALLESDSAGRVVIPWTLHAHWPIVETAPKLTVDLIYAPTLHNGLAWIVPGVGVSRPRAFDVPGDPSTVRLEDVSGDPLLWTGTLENLSSLLGRLTSQPTRGEATPELTGELIAHFKSEYAVMLGRYGETPRTRPSMPVGVANSTDQERRAWQAMVEKDLAERPRWEDELRRRFATEINLYSRPQRGLERRETARN